MKSTTLTFCIRLNALIVKIIIIIMMHETYIALFQTQSGFTKETTKTKKNSSPLLKGTFSSSSEIVSNFKEVCYEGLLDLDSSE